MPFIILLVPIWLTHGWWLLGYGAVLGVLWLCKMRGRWLSLAAVVLWLAVAFAVRQWPGGVFARLVIWPAPALFGVLAVVLAIWAMAGGLRALRSRSAVVHDGPGVVALKTKAETETEADAAPVSDDLLDRYARHIVLRELGGAGQSALRRARVLIVGAGGLGAPVCLYLAGAGVGRITVADDDRVSLSNLQRQVIFTSADEGRLKAEAARDAMAARNPHIDVTALVRRIGAEDGALIAAHDLVIDGTDSFAARAALNEACVRAGVPLIAGAIAQWEGQITIWDPARGAPCMACVFPNPPAPGLAPDCAAAGVVGPLPGVIGAAMALEAIKLIAGAGAPLRGRLMIFDGLYGENRVMKIARRADCPVCGTGHFAQG